MKRIMIDPPSGWLFGFPKEIPQEVYDNPPWTEWLIENGYPRKELEQWEGSMPCGILEVEDEEDTAKESK